MLDWALDLHVDSGSVSVTYSHVESDSGSMSVMDWDSVLVMD
jgi:hypothetical protein